MFVPDDQPAEVPQPGERPLDRPPPLVPPQLPPVLRGRLLPALAVRADQVDVPLHQQPAPQWVAVVPLVAHQPPRPRRLDGALRRPHVDVVQSRLQQFHLRRRGAGEVTCQRYTFTIDHHHPLRTLAPLGLADPGAPFFAGAKLPSAKHSSQRSRPCSSSVSRKARHTSSQTPSSSQSRSRRQQVEYDGYPRGRAFHRAPLRSTHRMPSTTARLGVGFGPPADDPESSGSDGTSFSHCPSVNSGSGMSMTRRRMRTSLPEAVLPNRRPPNNFLSPGYATASSGLSQLDLGV